jgi:GNAT superfamily N-acetyltransferase
MPPHFLLRDYVTTDKLSVNEIIMKAFDQYRTSYTDWPTFSKRLVQMTENSGQSEIIVAEHKGAVVGAVAYVHANQPKPDFYPAEWPMVRMLVVDPSQTGFGIGRALTEECIQRAIRDESPLIALHTSPIMQVALPLYLRMGFRHEREIPPVFGVPYALYVKELNA